MKQAIWDCDSFKSPCPEGISFGFIKQFWPELKEDFMRFVLEFHRNERLIKGECNFYRSHSKGRKPTKFE